MGSGGQLHSLGDASALPNHFYKDISHFFDTAAEIKCRLDFTLACNHSCQGWTLELWRCGVVADKEMRHPVGCF